MLKMPTYRNIDFIYFFNGYFQIKVHHTLLIIYNAPVFRISLVHCSNKFYNILLICANIQEVVKKMEHNLLNALIRYYIHKKYTFLNKCCIVTMTILTLEECQPFVYNICLRTIFT